MDYLLTKIIRNSLPYFFIWCGNDDTEPDHILVHNNVAPHFSSAENAVRYAETIGVHINTNAVVHTIDLDIISRWLGGYVEVPSELVLDSWNLLLDFRGLMSIEWKAFHDASDRASQCHFELSQLVIGTRLKWTSNSHGRSNEIDLIALDRVLSKGLFAFDSIVGTS